MPRPQNHLWAILKPNKKTTINAQVYRDQLINQRYCSQPAIIDKFVNLVTINCESCLPRLIASLPVVNFASCTPNGIYRVNNSNVQYCV